MKVENFTSNGKKVANQFRVYDNGKCYFQSYNSIIVMIENGKTYLDERFWDYSTTTGKYRNQFLNETKKETQAKIDQGIYTLTNLN